MVPPLFRFVNGESAYLANANGGPRMFLNLEDHLSKSTGVVNAKFQVQHLSFASYILWRRIRQLDSCKCYHHHMAVLQRFEDQFLVSS